MSDTSARLNLPFIAPSQAQKHVTHNEALQVLDAVTQMSAVAVNATTPPPLPESGAVYTLGAAPTGVWAGHAGEVASFSESGWLFVVPQVGWQAWDQQTQALTYFDGTAWANVPSQTQNTQGLGIQTTWDSTNILAVSGPASLLSHEGAGHQLKINKAATADTASLLFQSNWTGHAEFGLSGENAFSIKISDDGAAWETAMRFDPAAGEIQANLPVTGTAVQNAATDVTPGRLMRADYGYGPGNLVGAVSQAGGVPTGAVVESGETANGHYTRWADGTQMCWVEIDVEYEQTSRLDATWTFPVPFAASTLPISMASLEAEYGVAPGPDEILPPIARKGTAPANESCRIHIYRIAGATDFQPGDTLPAFAFAIGRWF